MKKHLSLILLHYFRLLSKIQLKKVSLLQKSKGKPLTIIGITGSTGKSSALNVLETLLSPHFSLKSNSGANSESGIPLNILGLKPQNYSLLDWLRLILLSPIMLLLNWKTYQIYLVEMGIDGPDSPKNMDYLLTILKPDISIFLNVNLVHSSAFDSKISKDITGKTRMDQILSLIASEKAKIINQLPSTSSAIINLLDPSTVSSTQLSLAKKYTIGTTSSSFFQIQKVNSDSKGFQLNFRLDNHKYSLHLKGVALPQSFAVTIASSLITAHLLDLPIKDALSSLESDLTFPPSRNSLLKGINDSLLIDSSYNSSPLAASEMLNLLNNFPSPKIAILGDMRELGLQSPQAHQELGKLALKVADTIITIGPETKKYFPKNPKIKSFTYYWQAINYLKKNPPQKASILIKGSQNTIFTEEVTKYLLENKSDTKKLCRQSEYWQKLKDSFKKENS